MTAANLQRSIRDGRARNRRAVSGKDVECGESEYKLPRECLDVLQKLPRRKTARSLPPGLQKPGIAAQDITSNADRRGPRKPESTKLAVVSAIVLRSRPAQAAGRKLGYYIFTLPRVNRCWRNARF